MRVFRSFSKTNQFLGEHCACAGQVVSYSVTMGTMATTDDHPGFFSEADDKQIVYRASKQVLEEIVEFGNVRLQMRAPG